MVRFRFFGCLTLTDEVMKLLAEHLRQLPKECAPSELLLEDCGITTRGFQMLMQAIEETDLQLVSWDFHPIHINIYIYNKEKHICIYIYIYINLIQLISIYITPSGISAEGIL